MGATGLLLACLLAGPPAAERFPPLPTEEKTRVGQAFRLVEEEGEHVWAGFKAEDAPVLLIVGDTEYLLNSTLPPEGFSLLPGEEFLGRPVFARGRVFPPQLQASFPAIGRETVVLGTAGQTGLSPTAWAYVLGHELFHVFQASQGLNEKIHALAIGPPEDSNWHLSFPFPYAEPEVASKLRQLGDALHNALETGPEEREQLLLEARRANATLRELRALLDRDSGDARAYNYLRYQTGKEGVARYVEYRLAQRTAESGETAAAALWQERYAGLLSQLDDEQTAQRQRSQFYVVGLGLALLLDRLDPGWKEHFFERGLWLDDLLDRALAREGR